MPKNLRSTVGSVQGPIGRSATSSVTKDSQDIEYEYEYVEGDLEVLDQVYEVVFDTVAKVTTKATKVRGNCLSSNP